MDVQEFIKRQEAIKPKHEEKILDIRDLDITFKTSAGPIHAIRGVNIDLCRGETVAIVGESGSGKSVSVKAAAGILAGNAIVNSGSIDFTYTDSRTGRTHDGRYP